MLAVAVAGASSLVVATVGAPESRVHHLGGFPAHPENSPSLLLLGWLLLALQHLALDLALELAVAVAAALVVGAVVSAVLDPARRTPPAMVPPMRSVLPALVLALAAVFLRLELPAQRLVLAAQAVLAAAQSRVSLP